jgi:hypothetical protein
VAVGLAMISQADAGSGYGLIAGALVVLGFGIATAMAPATDAVMGSLLASGYRGDMESAVTALPAPAREVAQDSLAGALALGDDRLVAAAQDAFVSGMQTAALVAAAVALAGALIAAVFLPSGERAPAREAVPA